MKFIDIHINYHTMSTPGDLSESSYIFSLRTILNSSSLDIYIGLMSKVFANGPEDRGSIPGRVMSKI